MEPIAIIESIKNIRGMFGFCSKNKIIKQCTPMIEEVKNTLKSLEQKSLVHQQKCTELELQLKDIELRDNLFHKIYLAESKNENIKILKKISRHMAEILPRVQFSNEVDIYSLVKELQFMSFYPRLNEKRIIAIGGGFSVGKTALMNTFFQNSALKLMEGIAPTTIIPTYIMHNDHESIVGLNRYGGSIDLYEGNCNIYQKLSYKFLNQTGALLRDIMPFLVCGVCLDQEYRNLCFVDTPGYNPAGSFAEKDRNVSLDFINRADSIVWVIGTKTDNGNITDTDLGFLYGLATRFKNKKIYIVINQADCLMVSDKEKVLNKTKQLLDREKLTYCGISLFSSYECKEYDYIHKSFYDFLKEENNTKVSRKNEMLEKIEQCCIAYQKNIKLISEEEMKGELNDIKEELIKYIKKNF